MFRGGIKMNIYEKIQLIKEEFLKSNIKKSGKNKFANFVELSIAKKTFLIERAIHIKLFHAQFC